MSTHTELLEAAWRHSTGNAAVDALRRRSLAAAALQDGEMAPVVRALQREQRSQLDVHLEVAEAERHEASATALGQLMQRLSRAVREVAKSAAGVVRLPGDINVSAPAQGSVRLVFVEQPRTSDAADERGRLWSEGMETLTSTLALAHAGTDALTAAVGDLTMSAREAVRLLAVTIDENDWSISGGLTTRAGHHRPVNLSAAAAERLISAVTSQDVAVSVRTIQGVLDGWRWSTSTARIKPDSGAAIEAYVPGALREKVAQTNAAASRRAQIRLEVSEVGRGSHGVKRSYKLVELDVLHELLGETGSSADA